MLRISMDYLAEYGLFLAKALTLVLAILAVVGGVLSMVLRQRRPSGPKLEIEHLNKRYEKMEKRLGAALVSDDEMHRQEKAERKQEKSQGKAKKKLAKLEAKQGLGPDDSEDRQKPRVFVLDFDGDIRATDVSSLREEITAVLTVATERDQVLVRLESPGGLVYSYGLAASQLQRIRDARIPLTVAVDKMAASGGYMMACVGTQIIAAPFAMIGSIGVIAQFPNFHRVLKKHDIEFEMLHAGEYKRTMTMFGENTESGRSKMKQDLVEVHELFKSHIRSSRPSLDVDKVATGETWLGIRALELGLVDALQTSDDYLMSARHEKELLAVRYVEKKNVIGALGSFVSAGLHLGEKRRREQQSQLLM